MTSIVKVQKKGQLTIPNRMRDRIGLTEGGYVQVIARGRKIILEAATAAQELTPGQRRKLDARLTQGLADVKAGRVHGPFSSAKDASAYIERVVKERTGSKKNKPVTR